MQTISLPLAFSFPSRRSLPSLSHFLLSPKLYHSKPSPFIRNPCIRLPWASISVGAPKMAPSQPFFLDHKESGVLHFVKYHGLGNDFIMVDNRDSMEPRVTPVQAMKICNRNFGVGADGVIFVMPGFNGTDYTMRIFNSDGSEPEMCGNGVRCFARFISELENLHGTQRELSQACKGLGTFRFVCYQRLQDVKARITQLDVHVEFITNVVNVVTLSISKVNVQKNIKFNELSSNIKGLSLLDSMDVGYVSVC